MTFLESIKSLDACDEGYAWAETNNIQSDAEAWAKLQRPDWMLWLAKKRGLELDESKLRLFACDCAEQTLPIFERDYPEDKRPRQAIETARRFANGEATCEELDAVWDAAGDAARAPAWAAAGDAAGAAAWVAARDAAWDAARDAAGDAAWAAAWAAAEAAAWYAARDAAGDAAGAAAWDAARDAASDVLKPTVDQLQASAITLYRDMITGGVS